MMSSSTCTRVLTKIESVIRKCRDTDEKALITFVTGGYPSIGYTIAVVERMLAAGSDIVEIGVPFSDPLADGPTIQAANTKALSAGTRTRDIFDAVTRIRSDGYSSPIVLLVYVNTIYRFGIDRFVSECFSAGVDGLVIPDLPVEERHLIQERLDEATGLQERCSAISLIPMVAPTTSDERIRTILNGGSGFVYCVSTTGVTGVRATLPEGVEELLSRVRIRTDLPLAVGFGIGDPATASRAAEVADAVIVGSAVVKTITGTFDCDGEQASLDSVGHLVSSLKAALRV